MNGISRQLRKANSTHRSPDKRCLNPKENRDNSENNTQLQQQQKSLALRYKTIKQKCYKRRKKKQYLEIKSMIETQYFIDEKNVQENKKFKSLEK